MPVSPHRAPVLAIIGSAGNRDDAARLSGPLFDALCDASVRAASDFGCCVAVSGGAAFADHGAVRLFLEGTVSRLILRLPAAWDGRRFVPMPGSTAGTANTANRLHKSFSEAAGLDSLGELAEAIRRGAEVSHARGFLVRNEQVARDASHLVAFTFGFGADEADFSPEDAGFQRHSEGGLKDGGTAHTWNAAWGLTAKRHVNLFALQRGLETRAAMSP